MVSGVADRLYNSSETRSLIDYKYKKQHDATVDERRYNSPAAQMQRMRAAGLNPDLAYGQLAAGQAPPSLETDSVSGSQFSSAASVGMRLQQERELTDSNIAVNQSVIDKNRADAERASAQSEYYGRLTAISYVKEELMRHNIQLTDAQVENLNQSVYESISRVKLNEANIDYIGSKKMAQDIENSYANERYRAEIDKLLADIGLSKAKTREIQQIVANTALAFAEEYKILCNERALSDRSVAVASSKLAMEAYRQAETAGLIQFDESKGEYVLTEQGEKLRGVDAALTKVDKVVSWVVDKVSAFYSHHSFTNLTPDKIPASYEEDMISTYQDEKGRVVGRTTRSSGRRYH